MLSKQHDVGTGGEDVVELVEPVDFDFDDAAVAASRWAAVCARKSRARRTASAGVMLFAGRQRQVVVLDQDGVEQAGAMVRAAAAADGVLFEPPPAGRRLARVVDAGLACRRSRRTYSRVSVAMPESRPSRFSSGRSQTSMSRAEPASSATTVPAATSSPSAALNSTVDRRVHFVDHDRQRPQPGDHARLADDDGRPALLVRRRRGRASSNRGSRSRSSRTARRTIWRRSSSIAAFQSSWVKSAGMWKVLGVRCQVSVLGTTVAADVYCRMC